MTAHYARLSLETVRDEWEKATNVDINGQAADGDSGVLADAVWLKNSLSRAKMALPNGYCTLPLQQTCEYANAPLTELAPCWAGGSAAFGGCAYSLPA
jgi:hypothetical protein